MKLLIRRFYKAFLALVWPPFFQVGIFAAILGYLFIQMPWSFSCHALPLMVVVDMVGMASSDHNHNMAYVVAQAMSYLVVGSRCIQHLSEVEQVHADFAAMSYLVDLGRSMIT